MKSSLALAFVATLLTSSAFAQAVERVSPETASDGYLITISGANLGGATEVVFRASVGGFVGVWTQTAAVESASFDRVTAFVPEIIAGWAPPGVQGSTPIGTVAVRKSSGLGPFWETLSTPFYFLQGTLGFLENSGLGVTQPAGEGRASIAFDPLGATGLAAGSSSVFGPGAPLPGNLDFEMQLVGAAPGALPLLVVGAPGAGFPFGDGVVAISPGAVFLTLVGSAVDAHGDASVALPIPSSVAGIGSLTAQWGWVDPTAGSISISSGLQMTF
jgi:hypothetical protein